MVIRCMLETTRRHNNNLIIEIVVRYKDLCPPLANKKTVFEQAQPNYLFVNHIKSYLANFPTFVCLFG